MKKICALILSAILLLSCVSVAADKDYESLTVGTYTPLTGFFFTDMWGTSTSDIDARDLLHACSPVAFNSTNGTFYTNPTVVSGLVVTENDLHDHIYTIALCDDLKFSDGTPITAWDYAFSFLLMADPAIKELGGKPEDLTFLKGAEDYRAGKSDVITGIHVQSDTVLEITVSHEALPFFYELSYLDISPYPISVLAEGNKVKDEGKGICLEKPLEAEALKEKLFGENGYVSHPAVVSGPYTLASFDGEKAVFEANTYFKGDAEGNKPVFKKVTYVPVTAENAAQKLASGEIDLINKAVSKEATSSAMELLGGNYSMSNYPRSGLSYISFCCESNKVADATVRQALAMVMDKSGFTKAYTGDTGLVTDGFYGLGQWMYQVVSGAIPAPVAEPDENATAKDRDKYQQKLKDWERLSLRNVKTWKGTTDEAAKLLRRNGWTLNAEGNSFNSKTDTIRAKKMTDGQILTLDLKLYCPAEAKVKEMLEEYFVKSAATIGVTITVEEVEWDKLLKMYYRQEARDCDMIYIATNFEAAFDPSALFNPADEAQGYANRTGITDNELYQRALEMRQTEPGDTYNYCKKWIAFEERFSEVMPLIPIYTNVYFDFYTDALQQYDVSAYLDWPGAIMKAYMSDTAKAAEPV